MSSKTPRRFQREGPGRAGAAECMLITGGQTAVCQAMDFASRKESRKVRRLMRKEVTSVDRSPLFRLSGDEKGNPETYVTASCGVDENIDFFFS